MASCVRLHWKETITISLDNPICDQFGIAAGIANLFTDIQKLARTKSKERVLHEVHPLCETGKLLYKQLEYVDLLEE